MVRGTGWKSLLLVPSFVMVSIPKPVDGGRKPTGIELGGRNAAEEKEGGVPSGEEGEEYRKGEVRARRVQHAEIFVIHDCRGLLDLSL